MLGFSKVINELFFFFLPNSDDEIRENPGGRDVCVHTATESTPPTHTHERRISVLPVRPTGSKATWAGSTQADRKRAGGNVVIYGQPYQ